MTMSSTSLSIKPLKKCLDCGLEAHTEEELEQFIKYTGLARDRRNLCKKCSHLRQNLYKRSPKGNLVARYNEMILRCDNQKRKGYKNYGGRGITVCEEWRNNREAFIKWALSSGYKYGLTIDRRNNDGNYSPDNCRWVSYRINNRNKRVNTTNFELGIRICRLCKVEKPLTEFHKSKGHSGGYMYTCKKCRTKGLKEKFRYKNELKEKRLQETADPFLPKLKCRVCGGTKTTRHFDRNQYKKTGFSNICKLCRREQRKLERLRNKS